jgi:hypothetical protein
MPLFLQQHFLALSNSSARNRACISTVPLSAYRPQTSTHHRSHYILDLILQQHILALADSSARSQQLGEQAQPRTEQQPQSAPPTPSDTLVTPGSNGELGAGTRTFLESPGYRDDLRQQQSPVYEEDARGVVKARGFNEGAPLGLGLGLGMAPVLQRDVLKERGGNIDGLAA